MRFLFTAVLATLSFGGTPLSKPKNFPQHGPGAGSTAGAGTNGGKQTARSSSSRPPEFGYEERPQVPVLSVAVVPGAPEPAYESSFPVINVRYTYPPTAVDARRRLGIANGHKEILEAFQMLETRIVRDVKEMLKHVGMQSAITTKLGRVPLTMRNGIQLKLLRELVIPYRKCQ
jgi:hypothetical protein